MSMSGRMKTFEMKMGVTHECVRVQQLNDTRRVRIRTEPGRRS